MKIAHVEALARRLHRLERAAGVTYPPRTWILHLEEGEAIPDHVLAAVAAVDSVYVYENIPGYLGLVDRGDWTIGHCYWPGGVLIIWPDRLGEPRLM